MALAKYDDGGLAGSTKPIGWDIGTGSARTTGGVQLAPAVGWDIGTGANRTTGPTPISYASTPSSTSSYSSAPSQAIAPVSGPSFAAPVEAPAAPVAPVGGAQWYGGLNAGAKAAQDQSWLGGDSDYTAQIGEYDRALQTFLDRIMNQKRGFEQDANDATASTNRNQNMSLDALGEDFGARGLSYSGLYKNENARTNDRFNEAKGNIGKVLARNNQDADNRQADYQAENQISRGNAERSSLSRQAQRQALIDNMAGL